MFSQNIPLTKDNILEYLETNFTSWTSGNKKIDDFIQERQLKINDHNDIVLEWIPYNQFNEIKETGKNGLITVYSAIWKDGPLYKMHYSYENYTRDSNKEVALKCLHNSQESIDSIINEAKKYPTKREEFQVLYGISQNPDTGDYIFVQNYYFINLTNCISGNEKIDDFIQERQLKINYYDDIVLEWIPYNQFNEIKETGKNDLITVYSAIWKDGPLYKKYWQDENYTRDSNKKVALKCLHNSQESIDSIINEAKKYPTKHKEFQVLYGISQNPDTGDYIFVQTYYIINLTNWISGNEKIDDFIQERQLKINYYDDIVLEWIPYNQFNEIKETGKNGLITVYSAIWKDGPLYKKYWQDENYTRDSNKEVALKCLHNSQESIDSIINEAKKYPTKHKEFQEYTRDSNKKVALKYLHNLQESIDTLINEVKKYPTRYKAFQVLYGISQNPDTGDYIFVQNYYIINLTNWISGNEKIDDFIQERQLKIIDDDDIGNIVLVWVPYNQFNEIKETGKNGLITVYSAIWNDGPLYMMRNDNFTRHSNKKVALKCFHNSQKSIDSLINEAKKYPTKYKAFQALYGISQNPDTGGYILVLIWSSGNEKIDDYIKERQLKINDYDDIVLEWIPYNQFNEIKETGKNGLITVYSAIWNDGPLYWNKQYKEYTRDSNKKVALKYLYNLQESIDTLINEVKKYPTKYKAFQVLYGISKNPDTEDYILVLIWSSGNEIIDDFILERQLKINDYNDIVFEWIPYSQFNDIKEIGKGGFSTVYSAEWKNGPLEYDANIEIYNRNPNRVIALKCLHNSQSITDKFLNEVKEYSINKSSNILNIYGISQNPDTKEYIIVLQYAKNGNFNNWINKNYKYFNWGDKLSVLLNIIKDMGLCGEVDNIDETKIYGVMPYMAPEVLRGNPYTQAADIYSFGMIMYFVATGKQPFGNRAHDYDLALDICKGANPEISEPEAPSNYIDLMKKCWDLDKNNRPDVFEVNKLITSFHELYGEDFFIVENEEIEIQFKKAEEYRKANLSSTENYQIVTHPQAIYTSRLLNPITKDLPKNNDDYNSQSLDYCALPISFK
ncbi:uncharacterized protein OCT59_008316 [Rhizophagus irregularis]|nr:hypothetical protein OCT59_008316 [Rhizophagus irregularis]